MKCPGQEIWLEFLSIPEELGFFKRRLISRHSHRCIVCQKKLKLIRSTFSEYFKPEPDIAPSLVRVYSRLQSDETLILKGWKLNDLGSRNTLRSRLLDGGWLFRGVVVSAVAVALVLLIMGRRDGNVDIPLYSSAQVVPYAQIRYEDKDRVKVHYVRPQLLQSIEFETLK